MEIPHRGYSILHRGYNRLHRGCNMPRSCFNNDHGTATGRIVTATDHTCLFEPVSTAHEKTKPFYYLKGCMPSSLHRLLKDFLVGETSRKKIRKHRNHAPSLFYFLSHAAVESWLLVFFFVFCFLSVLSYYLLAFS